MLTLGKWQAKHSASDEMNLPHVGILYLGLENSAWVNYLSRRSLCSVFGFSYTTLLSLVVAVVAVEHNFGRFQFHRMMMMM